MPSVLLTESYLSELNAQEPWPQNVKLFQPNEVKQILLPDSSNCLAVQTYLKMCNLNFQVEPRKNAEYMSPSGKVPFIKCGAFVISELEPIISFINSKGISLSNDLDDEQKADMRAYMSLVNNVLANAEQYICWCDPTTLNEVTKPRNGSLYPWPLNYILNYTKRNQIVKRLGVLGWTQKNIDEVYKEIDNCCNALSQRLGSKDYFFGTKPTELDALVFGHVYSIIHSKARILKLTKILNKYNILLNHKNLVNYNFGPPTEWQPTIPKIQDKISINNYAKGEQPELISGVYTILSAQNIQKRQCKSCLPDKKKCEPLNKGEERDVTSSIVIETVLEKKILAEKTSFNKNEIKDFENIISKNHIENIKESNSKILEKFPSKSKIQNEQIKVPERDLKLDNEIKRSIVIETVIEKKKLAEKTTFNKNEMKDKNEQTNKRQEKDIKLEKPLKIESILERKKPIRNNTKYFHNKNTKNKIKNISNNKSQNPSVNIEDSNLKFVDKIPSKSNIQPSTFENEINIIVDQVINHKENENKDFIKLKTPKSILKPSSSKNRDSKDYKIVKLASPEILPINFKFRQNIKQRKGHLQPRTPKKATIKKSSGSISILKLKKGKSQERKFSTSR